MIRSYGIHEKFVETIERVYEDNRVKFELNEYINKMSCPMPLRPGIL